MNLVRRIRVFEAVSHGTGIGITIFCMWSLKPMFTQADIFKQIELFILFFGALSGVGTAIRVILMLSLPKSYWEAP